MSFHAEDYPTFNPLSCGRVTIDLDVYADNWRYLRDQVNTAGATVECAALVKADAYGILIDKAVTALRNAGCKTFFVATPEEGLSVIKKAPDAVVYILNGLLPDCTNIYINNKLIPVLNTLDEIYEWVEMAPESPAALHVDTGMNRLGLREEEARTLAQDKALVAKLRLSLLMTHLACADRPGSLMNDCQLRSFTDIAALFPGVPCSIANSAGIFNGAAFHLDLVRPGIALYGGAALSAHVADNPMKPVVKVEARILQIRTVQQHESVGYGAAEVVSSERRIATLGAGYADGYIRHAGSTTEHKGAYAFINGRRVPLVGRVSMDMIAVDVSDVPNVKRGDYVELFGPNVSVSELADHAATIDYEFFTGIGKRYARCYGPLLDTAGEALG